MPFPLLPLVLAGASVSLGANLYSQAKQRELYRYQRQGYERQLADYNKRNPTRPIRYPELSYPGRIRALDIGISQSYANSIGSVSRFVGRSSGAQLYSRSRSRGGLYSRSVGRTSRYL